jgi:hypothetical protein
MQHYHVASYPDTVKRKLQQQLQINQILLKILALREAYLATRPVSLSLMHSLVMAL